MFDFVRRHTRVLFFILLLLIIPSFALFDNGMDRMRNAVGQHTVAQVGSQSITQAEWDRANQQKLDRLRRDTPDVDVKLLDTPALHQATLDEMVRQRVLSQAAQAFHLGVGEERLKRLFTTDPQFAFLRNPDGTVNKAILAAQGLTSAAFAQRLQRDLAEQQVVIGVTGSSVVPVAVAMPALNAFFQQREVQVQRFEPADYASRVTVNDAELEAFYKDPAVAARFQAPEQVDVEYVVFDLAALAKDISVSEEALRAYYQQNINRYGNPEERRASHILIAVPADANAEVRANARAKADALLESLKKTPRAFAETAQKNSQDAGSARVGGDLDYLPRDGVVKPFGDALFALKSGGLSEVVETDQGFHIIQMTGQRGGDVRSFDAVRTELLAEVRKAEAQKKFPDLSLEFSNMVFEQADTLKPVADRWKLEVRTLQHLKRTQPPADPVVGNPKFLEAVFAADAIRDKHNTPAIELGAAQMVSARVLQHTPARQPALDEVKGPLRAAYVAREAAALARKEGEERLAQWKAAPPATLGQKAELVSRAQASQFPQPLLEQVLRAPAQSLPTLVGADRGPQGYVVALITRVVGVDPAVGADPETSRSRYAEVWNEAEGQAYLEALKRRFGVEIKAPR